MSLRKARKFKYINKKNKDNIRIISYNILAPSVAENNKHMTSCNKKCIIWKNRVKMIINEILEQNPDIICIQEMQTDKFYNMLKTFMKFGYFGIYNPQTGSWYRKPLINFGVAIFYKYESC